MKSPTNQLLHAQAKLRTADKKYKDAIQKLFQSYRDYGAALRAWRESKNISLRSFAKTLGVSAAFLSDVERGNRHPTERIIKGWCNEAR